MPHDCKGNELKPGNEVILRLRIREISLSEVACNVFADAIDVAGCCEYAPTLSCNSRLFEKVAPPEAIEPSPAAPPAPSASTAAESPDPPVPADPAAPSTSADDPPPPASPASDA